MTKITDEMFDKAVDILARMDFFNQRAGKALWFQKSRALQDADIQDTANDISFLCQFIKAQKAELERLEAIVILATSERNAFRTSFYKTLKRLKTAKADACNEFAEELTNRIAENDNIVNRDSWYITDTIDKLLKEMAGEQ